MGGADFHVEGADDSSRAAAHAHSTAIVVIFYEMEREAPRTLHSLSRSYQVGVNHHDYQVVAVDNGSPKPLSEDMVATHGDNFRLLRIDDALPSPVCAMNEGVRQTDSEFVGLMIDGARIVSPGVLHHVESVAGMYDDPIIATLGFHLGSRAQQKSTKWNRYSAEVEDALLDEIGWPANGYRLFEISALAGSSSDGWYGPISESNCLFMSRTSFDRLGGYDERFVSAGGGLANLDLYRRACELPGTTLVMLLGEGSFHQVHGGVTTEVSNRLRRRRRARRFDEEYASIRGYDFQRPTVPPVYLGEVPPEAMKFAKSSAFADGFLRS